MTKLSSVSGDQYKDLNIVLPYLLHMYQPLFVFYKLLA